MWNPMPGPARESVRCKERPDKTVYEVPLGGDPEQHAHVNPHGVTWQCDGELEEVEA